MEITAIRPEKAGEDQLIRRSLKGDSEAVEQLFARYSKSLYPTALKLMGNPEDAEDALQDGLLSAFRNLRRFEGRSQFSTWLTRIVINAALMRLRSQRSRPTTPLDGAEPGEEELSLAEKLADHRPDPEQVLARREIEDIFESKINDLSPALREAYLLREVAGLSTEEAARQLGVPEGTLKSQLHRARHQLTGLIRDKIVPRASRALAPLRARKLCPTCP